MMLAFEDQTRKRRKASTYHVTKNLKGKLYTTWDDGEEFHWTDIYFLSKKDPKGTFYNATLETTREAYKELCESTAFDRAEKICPSIGYRLGNLTQESNWNGMRWIDFITSETTKIMNSGNITVCPEIKKLKGYRYGIGLHATLDVPMLNRFNIEAFIVEFWEMGEPGNWKGQPISFPANEIDMGLHANHLKLGE